LKPAPFRYERPATVEEAVEILVREGDGAKPLAGGQSLIPAMNFRLAQPAVLVDLADIGELVGVREGAHAGGMDGSLIIGSMTRHATLERSATIRRSVPLVAEMMPWIAHPQIRNRGTIGGSLSHADPAAELPAAMLALAARFHLRGPDGDRVVPVAEFYTGLFGTALGPAELMTAVEIPALPPRTGHAFQEVARRHGDFALVGVCGAVTLDPAGRVERATITLLSVGDGPVRATGAEEALVGRAPTPDAIREAGELAASRDIDPPSDIHASAAYRRQLALVLTQRALATAAARAS
jgi:carbon-monoxide dehydrogenase medium subunit